MIVWNRVNPSRSPWNRLYHPMVPMVNQVQGALGTRKVIGTVTTASAATKTVRTDSLHSLHNLHKVRPYWMGLHGEPIVYLAVKVRVMGRMGGGQGRWRWPIGRGGLNG